MYNALCIAHESPQTFNAFEAASKAVVECVCVLFRIVSGFSLSVYMFASVKFFSPTRQAMSDL